MTYEPWDEDKYCRTQAKKLADAIQDENYTTIQSVLDEYCHEGFQFNGVSDHGELGICSENVEFDKTCLSVEQEKYHNDSSSWQLAEMPDDVKRASLKLAEKVLEQFKNGAAGC